MKNNKLYFWEWCILGIIILCLFLTFLFPDIMITTNASINFDYLLFKGKLYQLYSYNYFNIEQGFFATTCITYDFPIYIFFGLWNIPLYLSELFIKYRWEDSFIAVLYAKSFLIVLTFLFLYFMNKILTIYHLNKKDKEMYAYLFLSSSIVLMVLAMFGGYDILSVLFSIIGIYYYLKNDRKKFIFFFAIAVSLKLFALLIFIPLLLLKEKNLIKNIIYGIESVSILGLSKIIYHWAPMYFESMNQFQENMFGKLSLTAINGSYSTISIFMILYTLICIFCYVKKTNNNENEKDNLYAMYIPLIVYGSFLLLCQPHPQWFILIMPYVMFFIIYNKENRNNNLLIDIAFSVLVFLQLFIVYDWVFVPQLMKNMLFGFIMPQVNNINQLYILGRISKYMSLFAGGAIGTFIAFSYLNSPRKIDSSRVSGDEWNHWLILLRLFIIIPFALIIIYYYFR